MSPLANLLTRGSTEQDAEVDVSDLTASRAPVVVRVNLLPPEIAEQERFRRGQVVRGGVVVVAVAAVALATLAAASSASSAKDDLDAAQATSDRLATEVRALSDVPNTKLELEAARAQRTAALGNEVRWSHYLNDLGLLIPKSSGLSSLSVEQPVDAAPDAAGAVTSPLGNPGAATVTYSGQSKTNETLATLLVALAEQPGNVDPYFSSANKVVDGPSEEEVVEFAATVTVTDEAKSGRYTNSGS